MIPDHVLQLFPVSRRLNVHPSLIPLYRGPAPIQHVIADGRDETGVSIIEMKEKKFGADKGDIWAIKNIDIPPRSHYADLRDSLADEGGKVLVYVLRNMINGTITASPQDNSKASHAPFITTETAKIDFHTWDAEKIERLSRAIGHQRPLTTTYPSSETLQLHAPKALVRSHTATNTGLAKPLQALQAPGEATYDPTTGYIAIRCANDTYVYVPKLKQQHKKLLEAKAWWPGVRKEWIPRRVLKLGS
ncbi:hypothetical protein EW145_g219 [Phellinidium pouzarii]|uniref:Methionyl-tRNA formyltransferase n=1 Tax=Phellinidium pouzarii TaxID=167371 RepID=A0A4S4LJP3_9AGAM|nr:hypothetical protein EW145_g219 [Phellinidium pouzarii]